MVVLSTIFLFLFIFGLGLLWLISRNTIGQAEAVMQTGKRSNWWALSPHINEDD